MRPNRKLFLRILCTFICLYVFLAKIGVIIYSFNMHRFDPPIFTTDVLILCASLFLAFLLWGKNVNIPCKTILLILIVGAITTQMYSGIFDLLTRNLNVNRKFAFWAFDVPNLLSICILVILFLIILSRPNKPSHNSN